jgi:hypothetical protein
MRKATTLTDVLTLDVLPLTALFFDCYAITPQGKPATAFLLELYRATSKQCHRPDD